LRHWFAVAAATALITSMSTSSAGAAPPLEAYGRLPSIEEASISPSGQLFAVVISDKDGRKVVVRRSNGEVVAALSDGGSQPVVDIQLHAPPVSPVTVDRIHIEQVLVNLIRNAIDATAGRDGRGKHVYVRIHDIGEEVEVVVEDDGPGISPEIAQCLFEPFETGKRGGMGLGLWLSRELVHRNGGRIWWDPATVVGARFIFRLPRRASENL